MIPGEIPVISAQAAHVLCGAGGVGEGSLRAAAGGMASEFARVRLGAHQVEVDDPAPLVGGQDFQPPISFDFEDDAGEARIGMACVPDFPQLARGRAGVAGGRGEPRAVCQGLKQVGPGKAMSRTSRQKKKKPAGPQGFPKKGLPRLRRQVLDAEELAFIRPYPLDGEAAFLCEVREVRETVLVGIFRVDGLAPGEMNFVLV